ncbi:MAG: hypothetical protein WCG04_04890, partial [Alphaproteobacteria bacterium]
MFLISLLFFCLAIFPAKAGFATADTSFEVQKLPDNVLRFIAREKGVKVFDHYAEPTGPRVVSNELCSWQRTNAGILWDYKGLDSSHLTFLVGHNGDISFSHGLKQTNYTAKKSWGFKTAGILINKQGAAFYRLSTHAKQFHNLGVLKCLTADFHHNYYFNKGIMHFGDPSPVADEASYAEYLQAIDKAAVPHYQPYIIDDYGLIIAEAGLKITGLTHRIYGTVDTQELILDNASLDVKKDLYVRESIKGSSPRIAITGHINVGYINSNLHITDLVNDGQIYCNLPSVIYAHGILDNNGWIVGGSALTIHSQKPPKFLGKVLSNGDLQAIVDEVLAAAAKGELFASKNGKTTIDVLTIWRHRYILKWYWVYPDGRWVYDRTEGPFFTGETTEERTTHTIDSSGIPAELQDFPKKYVDNRLIAQTARDKLKDHLRGLPKAQKAAILSIISDALRDAGLDASDIQDILNDHEVAAAISGIADYESLTPEVRSRLETRDHNRSRCIVDVMARAQQAGMRAMDWIRANPAEFLNRLCDLDNVTAATTRHPYAVAAAGFCGAGRMGAKAVRGLNR